MISRSRGSFIITEFLFDIVKLLGENFAFLSVDMDFFAVLADCITIFSPAIHLWAFGASFRMNFRFSCLLLCSAQKFQIARTEKRANSAVTEFARF